MDIEDIFIDINKFSIYDNQVIGKGSFGVVVVAERNEDKKKFAAKMILDIFNFDMKQQMLFLREIMILHKLKHPTIVKFEGINFRSNHTSDRFQPVIITEYLPHKSLKEMLTRCFDGLADDSFTPTKRYIILIGIARGMMYAHRNNVIHRDLKPENILLDEDFYPRICDFGLSCYFYDPHSDKSQSIVGTKKYMAPEILAGGKYDFSVDVYAFGLIAYEVVSFITPYSINNKPITEIEFYEKIRRNIKPSFDDGQFTEKMKKLITKCLDVNPKKRPTFEEIYDELVSDPSYFSETIDDDEINIYISDIISLESQCDDKGYENKNYHPVNEIFSDELFIEGLRKLHGSKNEKNPQEAIAALKKSSSKGNGYSSYLLGLLYENGDNVKSNFKEAKKYFELSSKQGNSSGFNALGLAFQNGFAVERNYSTAFSYFKKAISQNNSNALVNIGSLYENGLGVKKNYQEALNCYEKAFKKYNDSNALVQIGSIYFYGKNNANKTPNFPNALYYLNMAADLNNIKSLIFLGNIYETNEIIGIDFKKAKQYYKKASDLGDSKATELYNKISNK